MDIMGVIILTGKAQTQHGVVAAIMMGMMVGFVLMQSQRHAHMPCARARMDAYAHEREHIQRQHKGRTKLYDK